MYSLDCVQIVPSQNKLQQKGENNATVFNGKSQEIRWVGGCMLIKK